MTVLEYEARTIRVDDEGYLENPDDWDEKVACTLAEQAGIEELTKDRMDVIRFLRDHYRKYSFFPILGSICKNVRQPKDCTHELFMDPLTAWKVAGLPRPSPQVESYLKGEGGVT